tara:strand:- start:35585 stop:35695 length:111 start_codon:yes stop_codon:yes gene_type:complete
LKQIEYLAETLEKLAAMNFAESSNKKAPENRGFLLY